MNLSDQQIRDTLHRHYKTKSVFIDCVPCDLIPTSDSYPFAVVVNTEPSGMRGKHWIAIYAVSPTVAEYFDTSGRRPDGHIKTYLDRFATVRGNDIPIQSPLTDVCGAYCVYFIVERCKASSFNSVVDSLLSCPEADLVVCCYYYGLH